MPLGGPDSERALILLRRPDAEVASNLLSEAKFATKICNDAQELIALLTSGAGLAILSEEIAREADVIEVLGKWVKAQPAWSDFPIIIITARADQPSRNHAAATLQERYGNVNFLERPFHPTTLVSMARTSLRSRRRQYDARAHLARYELLARELQHRTKNMLSVVLSIASASLRDGGGGSEALVARLHSLARAQDLIFEQGGTGARLDHVVRSIVDSFGARVSLEGPPVFLKAAVAQGFALIVHELATNAVKYGALTTQTGSVQVRWQMDAGGVEPTVEFVWKECGGPPAIPPQKRGFGTLLLERAVASFGGPPQLDYGPDGFRYQITALCR